MSRATRHVLRLLLTALLLASAPVFAAMPASWQFTSVLDRVFALDGTSIFHPSYADQQLSIGTHVNANGSLFGFWLTGAGEFRTYSLRFAVNPRMQVLNTPGFVGLAGGDITCVWVFCTNEYAYGIRVVPPPDETAAATAVSAFVNTPVDAVAVPASLPFTLYPGNFVDENRRGIVAATQVATDGQYGVIIAGSTLVTLADIPWVVAINDLAEPLVLAYDGVEGDCVVYGDGCVVPQDCDADGIDDHTHVNGQGHEAHGRGYGYGHDKCRDDDATAGGSGATDSGNGALLVRLLADGSTVRYRFPDSVAVDGAALAHVFPLALNDGRAILRGDVTLGDTTLDKRLLSCRFDGAALDVDSDGIVDCAGGLELLGGPDGSIRAGTVLGFTLTSANLLVGNHGFSLAGIGAPFVVDLAAATPAAVSLAGLAANTDGWEINEITDANGSHLLTGYGYRDCGRTPQAFLLTASAAAPVSTLHFVRSTFDSPAWLAPDGTLDIAPQVTGASGSVELRTWRRTPDDADWTLLQDWAPTGGQYVPAGYTGEVCFRIEARDTALPDLVRSQVVRYLVSVPPAPGAPLDDGAPDGGTVDELAALSPSGGSFRLGDLLGTAGAPLLVLLATLALRRRRRT